MRRKAELEGLSRKFMTGVGGNDYNVEVESP